MIKVDQYQHIRELYSVKGYSQRKIAKTLGISRNTVRKYCQGAQLPFEKSSRKRQPSVMTPKVVNFIKECLKMDEEEGLPSEAIQVYWGQAAVYINGQKTTVHIFPGRLCYSAMPFVMAFPYERLEALLEGHIRMFEFFNGVPLCCIYDNMRTIVKEGWGKFVRKEHEYFRQLKAHYAFKADFCNPGKGNEKGLVEGLIPWTRHNILVPVPGVDSFQSLNQLLLERCLAYQKHTIRGRSKSVGELFADEKKKLTQLPLKQMEPIKQVVAECNQFSTVNFDKNRYSAPVEYVGKNITVKASVFEVSLWHRGEQIASHLRLYGRDACSIISAIIYRYWKRSHEQCGTPGL